LLKSRSRQVDTPTAGAWIGAHLRIAGPSHEIIETDMGDAVETLPPQHLFALWKPHKRDEPFLRRFPHVAALVSVEEAALQETMLRRLPESAKLCVLRVDADWALVAQIVMVTDDHLRAEQHRLLQAFIDGERRKTLTTIGTSYRHDAKGFERFIDTEPQKLDEAP
jgi:hypothetical protein